MRRAHLKKEDGIFTIVCLIMAGEIKVHDGQLISIYRQLQFTLNIRIVMVSATCLPCVKEGHFRWSRVDFPNVPRFSNAKRPKHLTRHSNRRNKLAPQYS